MFRAVVDPGVLVSALISSKGSPAQLVLAWRGGAFELVVSSLLLDELREVLVRPKFRRYFEPEDIEEYLALLGQAETVDDPTGPIERVSADRDDDYLVALAEKAKVEIIVSGDRHLLELRRAGLKIVGATHFLEMLRRFD